jgi:DNA-binding IclR family transcriptional regulator
MRSEEMGAQSIYRAIQIINLVASYSVDGLRMVDIADMLRLTRPTAHRIVQTLVAQGWLMRPTGERRYFLGHGLFELGLTAAPQFKLRDICQPSLDRIGRRTGHISFLTIRSGRDAISIARSKGRPIELIPLQIGVHRPLGIGAGSLALLSKLEDVEVEQIVLSNARRLRSFGDINTRMLLESVKICRERGFASHDERLLSGVSGVAVTITDGGGEVLGAISISALQPRLSNEELYEIVSKLRREAKIIQGLIGNDVGYAAERVRLLSKT